MVFRVLNLKRGIQFHFSAPLTGCAFDPKAIKKSFKNAADERSTFAAPTIFSKKFSSMKLPNSVCKKKRGSQGHKIGSLVLNRVAK